jgi:formate dehydrogenase
MRATGYRRSSVIDSAACRGSSGCGAISKSGGHAFVVTSDKDGPDSVFEREPPGIEVVISQPFWPAYLTAERIAKAPELKLAITTGIGSDHVHLAAAIDHRITVAEVTYSNSISASPESRVRRSMPRPRPVRPW